MCQTYKAFEVVRSHDNGSKNIIIETACKRCSGNGVFNQYKRINNGRCYECEGTGVNEKEIKVNKGDKVQLKSNKQLIQLNTKTS